MPQLARGVNFIIEPTPILNTVQANSATVVAIGTAPLWRLPGGTLVGSTPQLMYSINDAQNMTGWAAGDLFSDWSLSSVITAAFTLYGVAPIIGINAWSFTNSTHISVVAPASLPVTAGNIVVAAPYVVYDSVTITNGVHVGILGTDYILSYNSSLNLVITILSGGAYSAATTLTVGYTKAVPSGVIAADVVAVIPKIELVYGMFNLVPSILIAADKWSYNPVIVQALQTEGILVNTLFPAQVFADMDPNVVTAYTGLNAVKISNNYAYSNLSLFWPWHLGTDGNRYPLSTHAAMLSIRVDAQYQGVPYASIDNQILKATTAVLPGGGVPVLTYPIPTVINTLGIVTSNYIGGSLNLWGEYTSAWPTLSDVAHVNLSVMRLFNWVGVTLILTCWQMIGRPGNIRGVNQVLATVQVFMNSLIAQQALLTGVVAFPQTLNPQVNLLAGLYTFSLTMASPIPMQAISFQITFDVNGFNTLFSGVTA